MNRIRFFLKFGQREHLESFVKGNLYCSNAQTFRGIEDNLKIKGQGDKLEAGTRLFAQKVSIQALDAEKAISLNGFSSISLHFESIEKIPIFCMFAVFDSDCENRADGTTIIRLSEETKTCIHSHFPKADSVAIITNPDGFLTDVSSSIGQRIEHSLVQYFRLDSGYKSETGRTSMDGNYIKYIMQGKPPEIDGNKRIYLFDEECIHRALFCKDVFFSDEQEYRIILPDDEIINGKSYPVKLNEFISIVPLEQFFDMD